MSTQQTSQDNPLADFGPNEWIVDEMYQRYLADPASVDPAWHDFFADYKPAMATGSIVTPDEATAANATAERRPRRHRRPGRRRTVAPVKPTVPGRAAQAGRQPRRRSPAPPSRRRRARQGRRQRRRPRPGAKVTTLRGVAARIVQNMDASLEVPTATSVRAVPAKLLVDNRIVINNHLARGRGGKVSFTHLIGWALVRALVAHPEMNNSFAEVDGKPALVAARAHQPRHRDRPGQAGRHPHAGRAVHQELRARWTSASSGRRTRTSSGGPAATS